MLINNNQIINSVSLALTFKCNCRCKHCFIECGPERKEIMDLKKMKKTIHNTAPYCKRMWLSGGEVTTVPDILDVALNEINIIKNRTSFPKEIAIQTNGYWAKDMPKAKALIKYFKTMGVTDIDISSNDVFHYEQMNSVMLPKIAAKLCEDSGYFKSVTLAGSPTKNLKNLGRCKELKAKYGIKIKYNDDCSCFNDNYIIYSDFNVYNCKWAKTRSLGYSYEKNIYDLVNDEKNEFAKELFKGGPKYLCEQVNKITGLNYKYDFSEDICLFCKRMTDIYVEVRT